MKSKITKKVIGIQTILLLLAAVLFMAAVPKSATAKSLYVIADIKGASVDKTQPVQAYDIGTDGKLTFQAEHDIPHRMLGAVGITIDTDNGFLFITYEASEEIQLMDARTMMDEGTTEAPDARDLAGIVYDHEKNLVYCVDRRDNKLYVYNWDPDTKILTHAPGSPFTLKRASAYGIALNEIDDLLYVANGTNKVTVYSTSDWKLVDTITLDRVAISIALGVKRGFLYTGGGFAGNKHLTQYHVATGTMKEVQVDPVAGVMGLSVDTDTGYVYLNTGVNNAPGGDDLQVYDIDLNMIDMIPDIGNPTGLVVPGKDIGYNPLGLKKTAVRGVSESGTPGGMPTVGVGDNLTYEIQFNNITGVTVYDVSIVDSLPYEVDFVAADDEGVSGSYDAKTRTFRWLYPSLPPEVPMTLELAVRVKPDVDIGTIISNTVTINSNQTPPTTKRFDVITGHNALNLTKSVLGGIEGQIAQVSADGPVTYTIQFENYNDFAVTNVSVFDVLPKEVRFVSAQTGTTSGKYDPITHTVAWSLPSLEAGKAVRLELNAHVNKGLAKGTIFTNSVTLESNETPPSTATADAIVGDSPSAVQEMKVLPEIIRRSDETYDIQASVVFPVGIGKDDIADVLPTLHPGAIKAKQQIVYGSDSRAKVIALFDKAELLEAVKGYGQVTLRMVGTLTSGRSYSGEDTVYITKYSGR
jgi:uncharacterized repeat protein (TIGR01451 family)